MAKHLGNPETQVRILYFLFSIFSCTFHSVLWKEEFKMKTFLKLFKFLFLLIIVILFFPIISYVGIESAGLAIVILFIFGPIIIFYKDIKIKLLEKKLKKEEKDSWRTKALWIQGVFNFRNIFTNFYGKLFLF